MMRSAVILSMLLAWPALTYAQGGPPLVTDDPGTPGNGKWEINLAARWTAKEDSRALSLPYADINYGWGDRVQLKFETGLITEYEAGLKKASGLGNYLAGVKIRFLDENDAGFALSTYPQVEFHGPLTSRNERINEDGGHLILPLEFAKSFGKWGVNPELGYDGASRDDANYFYGAAFAYEFAERKELLWELHGRTAVHSGNKEWLYNLGTRYGFSENQSLILSVGHSLRTFRDESAFLLAYLGVQFRL